MFWKKKISQEDEKLYASSRSFQQTGTKCEDGRFVTADEVRDFIVNQLSDLMETNGFKYTKSKKEFTRKTAAGQDSLSIGTFDHTHYEFTFCYCKRIDDVQKIITAFKFENGFNTVANYKEHNTISCGFDSFKHIEAVSYSRLEKALSTVVAYTKEVIPYYEKLNSMEYLNNTLNFPEEDENNPFSWFSRKKGNINSQIAGLIVAKIQNDSNFNKLLEKYKQESNPIDIVQINKLQEWLGERIYCCSQTSNAAKVSNKKRIFQ